MNNIKVWPQLTLVAILCAVIAGGGVAFYLKNEQTAQAEALPNAARIQRVDGEVAISNALYPNNGNEQTNYDSNTRWIAASANQPFSVGDRIYTRDNSRTSLAFTGRNFARLNPNTALDVIALEDRRTQLALRDGSALFDVGYLAPGQLFEVGTPYGAVDFDQPGLYSVGLNNGGAIISVLSGLAQVVGLGGSGQISKGEMLTLLGATAAQVALSSLDRRDAGYLVDDYYRYQYPNYYDGRYSSYDAYLSDPFYYDPYRRYPSYQYASALIPGLYDLDYYGDWQNVSGYGYAWRPRVDSSWVPYQQGYWVNDYPYGLTWVSSEPWGYAPYHYGRWAFIGNQWLWIPDAVNTSPLYSPALVAFIPFNDVNQIGWVPLGPGDPYAPRYYDANWQPYYLTRTDVYSTRLVNLAVPTAVTVVPIDAFGRTIDPRVVTRVNPQMLTQVRPVLDPLLVTPLRNAVLHSAWGRGKIDLPPGIARKLETPVITSVAPPAPPFGKNLARAMRVEPVPEKVKNEKLKLRDERQGNAARVETPRLQTMPSEAARNEQEAARKQQMADLATKAAQGNRDARRQMQQLEQEQRKQQLEEQRAQRALQQTQREQQRQQAQGERVGRRAQQEVQRELPRPEPRRVPQQIERTQQPPPQPRVQQQPPARQQVTRPAPPRQQVQQPPTPRQQVTRPAPPRQVQQPPAPRQQVTRPAPPRQVQQPPAPRQQVTRPAPPRQVQQPPAPRQQVTRPAPPRQQVQQQAPARPQVQQQRTAPAAKAKPTEQPAAQPEGGGKGKSKKP
jgi:hypothetical protein